MNDDLSGKLLKEITKLCDLNLDEDFFAQTNSLIRFFFPDCLSAFFFIDASAKSLISKTLPQKPPIKEIKIPIGKGITGKTAIADTIRTFKHFRKEININIEPHLEKARSVLSLPLVSNGSVFGVFQIINLEDEDIFDDKAAEKAITIAGFLSAALKKTHSMEALKGDNLKIKVLSHIEKAAAQSRSSARLAEKTTYTLKEHLKSHRISIIAKDGSRFRFVETSGFTPPPDMKTPVTVEENVLNWCIKNRHGIFANNIEKETPFGRNKRLRYKNKAFMCSPYVSPEDQIKGFISVSEPERLLSYDNNSFDLLKEISKIFFPAWQKLRTEEKSTETKWHPENIRHLIKFHESPDTFKETDISTARGAIYYKNFRGDLFLSGNLQDNDKIMTLADFPGEGSRLYPVINTCSGAFSAISSTSSSLADLYQNVSSWLHKDPDVFFFSACTVSINNKTLTTAAAGSCRFAVFFHSGKKAFFSGPSKPLGVSANETYSSTDFKLKKHDIFMMFSDALLQHPKSRNKKLKGKQNQTWNEDALTEFMKKHAKKTPETIKDHLIKELKKGKKSPNDDILFFIIKMK